MKRLIRTPKEKEAARRRLLEQRAKLTLAFQLGFYIGEEIVRKDLPTLNIDSLKTRSVINVTPEETAEIKRLNELWYAGALAKRSSRSGGESEEWKALRAYHEMLEAKYLPAIISSHFSLLNITTEHMEEFKTGISTALWDSDLSHYSTKIENIIVEADKEGYFTTITLKRE